jgi:hypothetical protein
MKRSSQIFLLSLFFGTIPAFSQGGKAEPREVRFAKGTTRTTLTGTLSNGQEMEYLFSAKAGQKIVIRNGGARLFDVRVFSLEHDLETEFDSSGVFEVTVAETGTYNLFVRKKMVDRPRRARFSIDLSIR